MNHNKSNKVLITILIVMAVIAAVLLAAVVGYIVGFNNGKKIRYNDDVSKTTTIETKNQESTTEEITTEETTLPQTTKEQKVDVSSIKVGKYTSDNQSEDSVYADGGNILNITSIKGRKVSFEYLSISAAPSNRIARVKVSNATFDEKGRAEFRFDDDGWENRGTGMLFINKNKTLQVNISIAGQNSQAMWNVAGSNPLSYIEN